MTKAFVIDLDYCNGCYSCQYACKDEHVDNAWPPYSLPQPNTGQFWLKVLEEEHGSKPRVRVQYTPTLCNHCEDAPCMKAAPEAVYRREDGLVIVDPVKAKGLRDLVESCPYGAIYYNEEYDVPQKCTGCAHLVDEGKLPHCVDVCGQNAIKFGDVEDLAEDIARAEVIEPGFGTKPQVYYLNLPHLFINGEVWDPIEDEIIENATITLTMPDGATRVEKTDDFGEFWFKRIDEGDYTVRIEATGFKPVEKRIALSKSVNLGDFPLERI